MTMDVETGANGRAADTLDRWIRQARAQRASAPADALALAQSALDQARSLQDSHRQAQAGLLCAELRFDLSDYTGSCTVGAEALARFEPLDDAAGHIDCLRVLGRNHEKLGHDDQAQALLQRSLDLARRAGDARRAGNALLCLGHVRHNAGDFSGAIGLARQAAEIGIALQDADLRGKAEAGLANAFARIGDYARALAHHQHCLQQFDAGRFPREHAYVLNNIGNVHHALGDQRSAIDCHQRSLDLKRQLHDRWGEGTSLQSLGDCHAALADFDRASACYEASLPIVQAIGDQEGECLALQSLGDMAVQRGQPAMALQRYAAGLQLSRDLGRRYNEVMLLQRLGKLHRQNGDPAQAHAALAQALQLAGDLQVRREMQGIHLELVAHFEAGGQPAQALAHLKQAYQLEHTIFSEDLEAKLRHLKLSAALEQAEQEKAQQQQRQAALAGINAALARSNAELSDANAQKEKLLTALERQKRQLQRQSTQDALTGLANRRLFDQALARGCRAARRNGQALSVVICDIDNFKSINDRFSHQAGDMVLQTIARLLQRHSRKADLVARYGGEEFALLLPGATGAQALAVCEKIRLAIVQHAWHLVQPGLAVTISMGIADDRSGDGHAPLMALADSRLYHAKHAGKNQVVLGP